MTDTPNIFIDYKLKCIKCGRPGVMIRGVCMCCLSIALATGERDNVIHVPKTKEQNK